MDAQYIVLIVVGVFAAIAIALAALYYILLPKKIIKKIRSGEDAVSLPLDYDKYLGDVICEKDLIYPSRYPSNTYDFYRPKRANKPLPTIIWVHGGFFLAGDKKGVENLCTYIAYHGYNVIAMNYAYAPEYKYPTAIKQVDEISTHLINTKDERIDTSRIFYGGDSAGGQIAAQYLALVTNSDYAKQADIDLQADIDISNIRGGVFVCAPINIRDLYGLNKKFDLLINMFARAYFGFFKRKKPHGVAECDIISHANANFPPSFITDGNHISFEKQNRELGEKLRSLGVETTELYFPKEETTVNHEYIFKMDDELAVNAAKKLCEFLDIHSK